MDWLSRTVEVGIRAFDIGEEGEIRGSEASTS